MSRHAIVFLILFPLVFGLIGPVNANPDWTVDEQGRRFRVGFHPEHEFRLGLRAGVVMDDGEVRSAQELLIGLQLEHDLRLGEGEDQIHWNFGHALLAGRLDLRDPQQGDHVHGWDFDASLYHGEFRRHSAEPYWVLPTTPPRRFFFPFDVGLASRLGRLRLRTAGESPDHLLRLEVADARVLLDPWRSSSPGNRIEFGLGVRYSIDWTAPGGSLSEGQTIHRVAPLTATSLHFHWRDAPGRTSISFDGHLVPHWASQGGWALGAEAQAGLQRVLLAINDQPLSLNLAFSYQRWPGMAEQTASHELRATLGLSMGWQLR